MWRLLVQAGLGLATFDIGRRIANAKRKAVYFAVAGVIGFLGLGALTAALVVLLTPRLGPAGAAAAVGAALVVVAGLVALVGARDPAAATRTGRPIVDRVRTEVGAAGAALSAARAERRAADPEAPPRGGRNRALNMVLIATLAGVVLGRRL